MKRLTPNIFYALLFFTCLSFNSCSDDEPTPTPTPVVELENKVSFFARGGEFNNQLINFSDFAENNTKVSYDATTDITSMILPATWNGTGAFMSVFFEGETTGLFQYRPEGGEDFFPEPNQKDFLIQLDSTPLFVKGITFQIDEYGAVGELVKGTFFGEWEDGFSGATVTITSGEFELIRTE